MKKTNSLILLFALAGLGFLAYPGVCSWWNGRAQSRAVADYAAAVQKKEELTSWREDAEAYNEALVLLGSAAALREPDLLQSYGYGELLDLSGTGVMGILSIPRIRLELPVYHGSSAAVLSAGAGHLEGSSLPVGGESTHCVLTGHRGLPSARLFTALDQLEVGDIFTLRVLEDELSYQVDQIRIVEPSEFEDLYIEEGRDLCTLMTCTPYGVNSHRLLVRGERCKNAAAREQESGKFRIFLFAAAAGILLILLLLLSNSFSEKHADRIKHTKDSHARVRKHRQPQGGESAKSEHHDQDFHDQGKNHILPGDGVDGSRDLQ